MPTIESREIRLASRPQGRPTAENFELAQTVVSEPRDGHVLVRNHYLSVDPCVFCRMRGGKSHLPAFKVGEPLEGGAVGMVVESRSEAFKPGDIVISNYGWREWYVASAQSLRSTSQDTCSLSAYLNMLGLQRICPWAFSYLTHLKPAEVLLVSGAVRVGGSVASQLSQLRGCRIIGSAGSREMLTFLREECGFNVTLEYGSGAVFEQLEELQPGTVDTNDSTLEAALGVCMASSFVAKVTPDSMCNGPDMPLPVYFLSQQGS